MEWRVCRPGDRPQALELLRSPRCRWGHQPPSPQHAALISCQTLISRRLRRAQHLPRVKYNSPSKAVFGANAAPLGPLGSLFLLGPGESLGLGARRQGWADLVRSSAPRGIADPPRELPSEPERAWAQCSDFPALLWDAPSHRGT